MRTARLGPTAANFGPSLFYISSARFCKSPVISHPLLEMETSPTRCLALEPSHPERPCWLWMTFPGLPLPGRGAQKPPWRVKAHHGTQRTGRAPALWLQHPKQTNLCVSNRRLIYLEKGCPLGENSVAVCPQVTLRRICCAACLAPSGLPSQNAQSYHQISEGCSCSTPPLQLDSLRSASVDGRGGGQDVWPPAAGSASVALACPSLADWAPPT